MENGRDEEEDALEDSLDDPSTPIQLRRNVGEKRPEGRAPTMTIEVVRVGRPLKVISLLFAILSLLLFTMGTAGTSWIYTEQRRFGLFQECDNLAVFDDSRVSDPHLWDNCITVTDPTWDRLSSCVLDLTAVLFTLIGIVLLSAGMLTLDIKHKSNLYKAVLVLLALACASMVATIVLFPYKINETIKEVDSQTEISIGWSCMVNGVGCFTLLIAIVLLALDRKAEEIVYRETIHRFPEFTEQV